MFADAVKGKEITILNLAERNITETEERDKSPSQTGWQTLDIVPSVSFAGSIATPVLTDLELITSAESGTGL